MELPSDVITKSLRKARFVLANRSYDELFAETVPMYERAMRFEIVTCAYANAVRWGDLPPWYIETSGAPETDCGIDGAGNYVVVQSKMRTGDGNVSWDEVAKFLALSGECGFFNHRRELWCSEDATVTKRLRHVYDLKRFGATEYEELCERLRSIPDDSFCDDSRELRPYQMEALRALRPKGETRLLLACGTGKTLLMVHLVRDLIKDAHSIAQEEFRVCIVVPSIVLMDQIGEIMTNDLPVNVVVCLVGTGHNDRIDMNANVYVAVVDSLSLIMDIEYDLMLVDEAHHYKHTTTDDSGDSDSDSDSAILVDDVSDVVNYVMSRSRRTVSMSATLSHADYTYDLRTAINDGWLTDYHIHTPIFLTDGAENVDTSSAYADYVARNVKSNTYTRVLAYSNRLDAAKRFADSLEERGVKCGYFDGTTPIKHRKRIIGDLTRGTIQVLSTVNTIGEGMDIPSADCVVFVEPRRSHVSIIQCVGRVVRLGSDKPLTHVVLPVTVYNTTTSLDVAECEVAKFLRMLAKYDTEISRSAKRGSIGSRLTIERCDTETIDERSVEYMFENVYDSIGQFVSGIDRIAQGIETLRKWCVANKRRPKQIANPKTPDEVEERRFAKWMDYTRSRSRLTDDHKKALCEIEHLGWKEYCEEVRTTFTIEDNIAAISKWCSKNKRRPKQIANPKTPGEVGEKRFAQWMKDTRRRSKLTDDHKKALCKIEHLGWKEYCEDVRTIEDNIAAISKWCSNNKRRPKQIANPKTPGEVGEKRFAQWMCYTRRRSRLTDDHKKALCEIEHLGWKEYCDRIK
uniref:Type III restriction enzyme n=1 Tax=viral metagenome TaxID=1070528 RepID=A0A6C0LXD6_9ZZZZ